jgi:hypothetical protein
MKEETKAKNVKKIKTINFDIYIAENYQRPSVKKLAKLEYICYKKI